MEYGTIRIKLDELIEQQGISKNKLSHKAEMQRTQINNYCNNNITRLDIDVLPGYARCWIVRLATCWNLYRRTIKNKRKRTQTR